MYTYFHICNFCILYENVYSAKYNNIMFTSNIINANVTLHRYGEP